MIVHIVMWKLKDSAAGNSKEANAKTMKEKLESPQREHPRSHSVDRGNRRVQDGEQRRRRPLFRVQDETGFGGLPGPSVAQGGDALRRRGAKRAENGGLRSLGASKTGRG